MTSLPVVLLWLLFGSATASIPVFDSETARLASLVSRDSMRVHLERLQAFGSRYALSDSCRAAERYLHDYFESVGLDSVAFDTVPGQGVPMRNVLGFVRGSVNPAVRIMIGAHLDAMSEDPLHCAPGMEDNGSGVAVVMEAARILAGSHPRYTLEFVAFTGEELSYLGSEHLAAKYETDHVPIVAFLNLDMIAWRGGAYGMKVICDSITRPLAEAHATVARLYTKLDPEIVQRVPLHSDNYPFQIRGIPAISYIERFEHDTDGYKWYHSCSDSLHHLDLDLAAEIAQAGTATLLAFQDLPDPSMSGVDPRRLARSKATLRRTADGYELDFDVSSPRFVELSVLDLSGKVVRNLSPGWREAGTHRARWTNSDIGNGVFLLRSGNRAWRIVSP